jgi:hypothetical protein
VGELVAEDSFEPPTASDEVSDLLLCPLKVPRAQTVVDYSADLGDTRCMYSSHLVSRRRPGTFAT